MGIIILTLQVSQEFKLAHVWHFLRTVPGI